MTRDEIAAVIEETLDAYFNPQWNIGVSGAAQTCADALIMAGLEVDR